MAKLQSLEVSDKLWTKVKPLDAEWVIVQAATPPELLVPSGDGNVYVLGPS